MRLYAYAALAIAIAALVAAAGAKVYRAGYASAENKYQAEIATAVAEARAEEQRKDRASAEAGAKMLDFLRTEIPASETRTHDTIERIRTVYKDRPVPADCRWPDGLQAELDQAIASANAAAR